MLEFADWQFWGAQKEEGSKISRFDNLKQAAKSGSKRAKDKLNEAPKLSQSLGYIWEAFLELNYAGSGTITYSDMMAFSQLKHSLTPFEVEAIQAMNKLRAQYG